MAKKKNPNPNLRLQSFIQTWEAGVYPITRLNLVLNAVTKENPDLNIQLNQQWRSTLRARKENKHLCPIQKRTTSGRGSPACKVMKPKLIWQTETIAKQLFCSRARMVLCLGLGRRLMYPCPTV